MRNILWILYQCIARWLPPSTAPGGRLWRVIRRWAGKPLLASAGNDINIEHGAFFGSGRTIRIGDRSGLGVDCYVQGPTSIGQDVMMGPGVAIYTRNHCIEDVTRPMLSQGFTIPRPVSIEDDVWIGTRALILPGVKIGKGAVIAAGAVVTKDVAAFDIVGGNPARKLRSRLDAKSNLS